MFSGCNLLQCQPNISDDISVWKEKETPRRTQRENECRRVQNAEKGGWNDIPLLHCDPNRYPYLANAFNLNDCACVCVCAKYIYSVDYGR